MQFTLKFFRVRPSDSAYAMPDRISQDVPDLDNAKVRAKILFETLDLPQAPDAAWAARSAPGVLVL